MLLRIAQFINRKTQWLNGLKNLLGVTRIAESMLVKKLTNDEIGHANHNDRVMTTPSKKASKSLRPS